MDFSSWYILSFGQGLVTRLPADACLCWETWNCLQFLQITIGYIVAAPIRYGIELDAVRKLHPFSWSKPAGFALWTLPASGRAGCLAFLVLIVIAIRQFSLKHHCFFYLADMAHMSTFMLTQVMICGFAGIGLLVWGACANHWSSLQGQLEDAELGPEWGWWSPRIRPIIILSGLSPVWIQVLHSRVSANCFTELFEFGNQSHNNRLYYEE